MLSLIRSQLLLSFAVGLTLLGLASIAARAEAQDLANLRGSEFLVAAEGSYPSIDADSSGGFVVVWEVNAPITLQGRRFDGSGAPIGSEFPIATTTTGDQKQPEVSVNGGGDFVVVWRSGGSAAQSVHKILCQRFASTGEPLGSEIQVNTVTSGDHQVPKVTHLDGNDFLVTWTNARSDVTPSHRLLAQRFDGNGSRVGDTFRLDPTDMFKQLNIGLFADPQGNFVATWLRTPLDEYLPALWGRRFNENGTALGLPFEMKAYSTGELNGPPSVAGESLGSLTAVWQSSVDLNYEIFGQVLDAADHAEGPRFQVNASTDGNQASPKVAASPDGTILTVWTTDSANDQQDDLRGQYFNESGDRLGDEFPVNEETTGRQFSPEVAAVGPTSFVAIWGNFPSDNRSIVGRRFDRSTGTVAGVAHFGSSAVALLILGLVSKFAARARR